MITKAEREADKALCAAAAPDDSLLMLDRDGMAIFWHEADAAAAVLCRNRLPAYIADAAEMERQLSKVERLWKEALAAKEAHRIAGEWMRALEAHERASAYETALRVLRGEL